MTLSDLKFVWAAPFDVHPMIFVFFRTSNVYFVLSWRHPKIRLFWIYSLKQFSWLIRFDLGQNVFHHHWSDTASSTSVWKKSFSYKKRSRFDMENKDSLCFFIAIVWLSVWMSTMQSFKINWKSTRHSGKKRGRQWAPNRASAIFTQKVMHEGGSNERPLFNLMRFAYPAFDGIDAKTGKLLDKFQWRIWFGCSEHALLMKHALCKLMSKRSV